MRSLRPHVALLWLSLLGFPALSGCFRDSPEDVVKHYLKAKKWRQRLAYVRNPERVRRTMEATYEHDHVFTGAKTFTIESKQVDGNTAIVATRVDEVPSYYLLYSEEGEWRIDWPSSVRHNPMTTAAFRAARPFEHRNFRVSAKASDAYRDSFRDEKEKYFSIALRDADGESFPSAYVLRASTEGKRIAEFLKDGEEHLVILKLSYPADSSGDSVLAHQLVATSWVDDQPKLADLEDRRAPASVLGTASPTGSVFGALQVDSCRSSIHASGSYEKCRKGDVPNPASRCACDHLVNDSKLVAFCGSVVSAAKPSHQACLESSTSSEEYSACMQVPLANRTREAFSQIYRGCQTTATAG